MGLVPSKMSESKLNFYFEYCAPSIKLFLWMIFANNYVSVVVALPPAFGHFYKPGCRFFFLYYFKTRVLPCNK